MDDRRAFGAPAFRVQPFQARPPYWAAAPSKVRDAASVGAGDMELPRALEHLAEVHTELIDDLRTIGNRHRPEGDVLHICHALADRLIPLWVGARLERRALRQGCLGARGRWRMERCAGAGSAQDGGRRGQEFEKWSRPHVGSAASVPAGTGGPPRLDHGRPSREGAARQGAQLARRARYAEAERLVKWVTTQVKSLSAQALTAG